MDNEIQIADRLSDFEALARFIPQWKQAQPEPFIQNPQNEVTPPTWNKIPTLQQNTTGSNAPSGQTEGVYVTFNVIIGGQRYLADFDVTNIRPA